MVVPRHTRSLSGGGWLIGSMTALHLLSCDFQIRCLWAASVEPAKIAPCRVNYFKSLLQWGAWSASQ